MAEDLLSGDTTAIWSSIDETSEPDGSGGSGGSGELLSLEGIGGR